MTSRYSSVLFPVAIALAGISVAPRAAGHGPAPSALYMVDGDSSGARVVRLTAGYAHRRDATRYEFLCPAAWGDDVVLPAAAIPQGPVVVAGGRGLFLIDAGGAVAPHPDPEAATPATDFARIEGKLYVLRTVGANSEVLEVTESHVRRIFMEPGNWTTIAATSEAIGLQRLTDEHLEQIRISTEGAVLSRDSAASPSDPIMVVARATPRELFAVVVTATGRELGRIADNQWQRVEVAVASIAGPVELSTGETYIGVDSELTTVREPRTVVAGAPPVSCLGELEKTPYVCTRDGLRTFDGGSVGMSIFALSLMSPPNLTLVPLPQQSLCMTQWEHFRYDLLALGVELVDAEAVQSQTGSSSVTASTATPASGTGGSVSKIAPTRTGGMGEAAIRRQDGQSGCTIVRAPRSFITHARRAQRDVDVSAFLLGFGGLLSSLSLRSRARHRRRSSGVRGQLDARTSSTGR